MKDEEGYSDKALRASILREGLPTGAATRAKFIDQMVRMLEDGIQDDQIRRAFSMFLRNTTVNEFLNIAKGIAEFDASTKDTPKKRTRTKPPEPPKADPLEEAVKQKHPEQFEEGKQA